MLMYAYISIIKYSYDNLETSLDNGRPDLTQKETAWKEIITCQNSSIKEYKAAGVCR